MMKNHTLKVISILIVVGFAATSFSVISNFNVEKISLKDKIKILDKPMSSSIVMDTILTGSTPVAIAYDSMNGNLYVVNRGSNDITVINNTNKIIGSIEVGYSPNDIAFDPLNGCLYVTNTGSNNVTVINDTNKVVDSISIKHPVALAFDSLNGDLYVTCCDSANVSVINDINNVIDTIPVGKLPISVAFDPLNGHIYVASFESKYLTVINDTNNVVDKIPVFYESKSLVYDSLNGFMYVSEEGSNRVMVINNTNKVVDTIQVNDPAGMAFNSVNGYIYVANCNDKNVTVINNTNKIVESISVGLEPIAITVNSANGYVYVANAASNNINVISPIQGTYSAEFSESGLPSGTVWNVILGNGTSEQSHGDTLTMCLSNGNYQYRVVTSDHEYRALEYSGSVHLAGRALQIKIQFTMVTYSVMFRETGLPSGTTWYLNIEDHDSGPISDSNYTISLPNGTYSYTIITVSGYSTTKSSGSINVKGNDTSQTVTFYPTHSNLFDTELYIIIGAIGAIILLGMVVLIWIRRFKK